MTSPGVSPQRKKLRLSRKVQQENEEGPNRLKDTQIEIRKRNFMKACLKVSFEAYQDFKKRFQLLYVPECINNMCIHGDRNANIKQISRSAEQSFKTEIKNNTWYEALEICVICITSTQYLSENVLKDIVEIIMNTHEDLDTGYTIEYLLTKCQHVLMLHFNMHPPCVTKGIRECYKKFLTSPMDPKKDTLSNRKIYLSDEGIVSHCFSRLEYEISIESNDGILIEKQEIPPDIEGVKRLHWKKENLELFELLERTERIERCMIVLESLIYLLQIDIALRNARHGSDNQMRSQRPLIMYLLWPYNCITFGTVTPQCQKIMKLFAYYVHLQYPERHIKTMSLWMNTIVQMFYTYDRHSGTDYPNTSSYCAAFVKEFYRIISPLPNTSILRILEKLQPSFMQYLVGIYHIQTILKYTQTDIIHIMISCVNTLSWEDYPVGDINSNKVKNILKPHKLMDYLSKQCRNFRCTKDIPKDEYPKLDLRKNSSKILQDHIIDILFTTFVAYLEMYSIKNFNQTLEQYNKNENDDEPISYKSYSVSDNFIKKYRSIVMSLQELLVILKEKQDDVPSKKLLNLINVYFDY